MFREGTKRESPSVSTTLFEELASCAAALGYRIVKADAELQSND
jgi:hypothetical protein